MHSGDKKALRQRSAFITFILALIALLLIGGLLLWLFGLQSYYLQLYLIREDQVYWEHEVQPGETFQHEYVHSVEKTPVIEKYIIDEDYSIVAVETRTKSFGAGLPFYSEEQVEREDGYYIIRDPENRTVPFIDFMPYDMYPHHFYFGEQSEEEIELSSPELSGKHVRVRVVRHR
jgi:hypothetical protein